MPKLINPLMFKASGFGRSIAAFRQPEAEIKLIYFDLLDKQLLAGKFKLTLEAPAGNPFAPGFTMPETNTYALHHNVGNVRFNGKDLELSTSSGSHFLLPKGWFYEWFNNHMNEIVKLNPANAVPFLQNLKKYIAEISDPDYKPVQVPIEEPTRPMYRKMNMGLLSKILDNYGVIEPLGNEGSRLNFIKGKPRKAPFFVKVNDVPIEEVIMGSGKNYFKNNGWTTKYLSEKGFTPVIGDNALLFRMVDSKYVPVKDPYTELLNERVVLSMKPASMNWGLMTKKAGAEQYVSPHQILTNGLQKPMYDESVISLFDDPYLMAGISNAEELKALTSTGDPNSHTNYFKSLGTFDELPYTMPDGRIVKYVANTKQTEQLGPNSLYDKIRAYILDVNEVNPMFQSGPMHTALLAHYMNNFGLDLSGLSLVERSKFMLKLANEGLGLLLFHSTNRPITKWDPSKLGSNTGNEGFYGRGLYLSDVPNQDYGLILQPIFVNGAARKAIVIGESKPKTALNIYGQPYLNAEGAPLFRLHSPIKRLDDLLGEISKPMINYKGQYKKDTINWPLFTKKGGFERWNGALKGYDILYATPSSQGSGVFSEIVLPETTNATIKSFFPHPDMIGKQRVWDDGEFLMKCGGKVKKRCKK